MIFLGLMHMHVSAQIGQLISPTDAQLQDQFARAVAIDDNFALVGAHSVDYPQAGLTNAGAVYVYRKEGHNWTFNQKLVPSIQKAWSFFALNYLDYIT